MLHVNLEIKDKLAIITISRPKQLNALNLAALCELEQALDQINQLEDIRCIIITGEGEKAFVAGADTTILESMNSLQGAEISRIGNDVFLKVQKMPMPVIAAVNGFALGGGLELALSCDIRIASENANFGLPEVTIGIMPGWGGTQKLGRLIGYSKAAELIFTGKHINAQKAFEMGIVNHVYPIEELMVEAEKLANIISANAPVGIRSAKKAMRIGLEQDINSGIELEAQCFGMVFCTEDKFTGLSAFNNRQKNVEFKNR